MTWLHESPGTIRARIGLPTDANRRTDTSISPRAFRTIYYAYFCVCIADGSPQPLLYFFFRLMQQLGGVGVAYVGSFLRCSFSVLFCVCQFSPYSQRILKSQLFFVFLSWIENSSRRRRPTSNGMGYYPNYTICRWLYTHTHPANKHPSSLQKTQYFAHFFSFYAGSCTVECKLLFSC